eukprot:gene32470-5644_t
MLIDGCSLQFLQPLWEDFRTPATWRRCKCLDCGNAPDPPCPPCVEECDYAPE